MSSSSSPPTLHPTSASVTVSAEASLRSMGVTASNDHAGPQSGATEELPGAPWDPSPHRRGECAHWRNIGASRSVSK
jgi:hypothetical protein